MSHYDCLLTLALPAALEEEALDFLQEHPEWVNGFSVVQAEGFGSGSKLRSTLEQVRGRSQRILIQLLCSTSDREALTTALYAHYPSNEIAWWTTPVTGFGRLA
ncbi:MAG: DUF3240 family protein [Steroidobacteraceae bacterium]